MSKLTKTTSILAVVVSSLYLQKLTLKQILKSEKFWEVIPASTPRVRGSMIQKRRQPT